MWLSWTRARPSILPLALRMLATAGSASTPSFPRQHTRSHAGKNRLPGRELMSARTYLVDLLEKPSEAGSSPLGLDWSAVLDQILDGRPMYDRAPADERVHPLLKPRKPADQPKPKTVTPYNCDVFILKSCLEHSNLDAAMSYLAFLQEQGTTINSSHLLILIRLVAKLDHEIPEAHHDRVMALVNPDNNPLFKAKIAKDVDFWYYLATLANSRSWIQAHETILAHLNTSDSKPSALDTVNHLVRRLLHENRWNDALTLVRSPLFHQGMVPLHEKVPDGVDERQSDIWVKLIKYCQRDHDHAKVEELFKIMREIDYFISERVFRSFQLYYRNQTAYFISMVSVNTRGYCRQSKQQLPEYNLTSEEHKFLKDEVSKHIMGKSDSFRISNPEEMQRFQNFVSKEARFDIVLDGLNIAHTYRKTSRYPNKLQQSKELQRVVETCLNEGLRPLVIGRPYVTEYPCYDFLLENCELHILSNVTQDDPFIIMSALSQGPNVDFISNDTFRDHCVALGEKNYEAKRLFTKWQISRQRYHMIYTKNGNNIHDVQKPTIYQTNACQVNGDWYLPLKPEIPPKLDTRQFLLPPRKYLLIQCT